MSRSFRKISKVIPGVYVRSFAGVLFLLLNSVYFCLSHYLDDTEQLKIMG